MAQNNEKQGYFLLQFHFAENWTAVILSEVAQQAGLFFYLCLRYRKNQLKVMLLSVWTTIQHVMLLSVGRKDSAPPESRASF